MFGPSRKKQTVWFVFSYNENRRIMDFGYPKYISDGFPGVNATINAAVHKDGKKASLFCISEENKFTFHLIKDEAKKPTHMLERRSYIVSLGLLQIAQEC